MEKKLSHPLPSTKRHHPRRVKTPTVLQMEAVECGAASLAIILQHFGSYVPLEELRIACDVSRDGSKASNLVRAARTYGLEARGYRKQPDTLRNLQFPVILHWNFNHYLVLEGFKGDRVYVNDPGSGPRCITVKELDDSFTGVVLTFAPDETYQPVGSKPHLATTLRERLRGSEWALFFVVLVSLALVIPGLLLPAFSRIFIDFYLENGQGSWVPALLIGMGLTALIRAALTWLQQSYLVRLETKLALTNASQLFWHILRLPVAFFTQRTAGDISARVGQNDRVAQLLSGQLATTLLNCILLVFYALLMLRYSLPLTIVVLVMAAFNFAALRIVSRRRVDTNRRLVEAQGKLLSTTFGSLQQIETIKSTGSEADAFVRWAGFQAKAVNAAQELGVTSQTLNVVPIFLKQLTTLIILSVGGYLIIEGQLTIGMLVAFQSLTASFLAPVAQLVNLGSQVQEIESIINRLSDVLNYEVDPQTELSAHGANINLTTPRLSGRLEISDLTFGYSRLSPPLIEGFNLTIEPGMRVALVGGSGSGKSTIARLVAGLYQPWSGEIRFDGRQRRDIDRALLNSSVRMVDQELFLFEGSIRDNITMWDRHTADQAVVQAAKDAEIHAFISGRPQGYDALVKERGQNFSGGQRQRLEIARSLVVSPSLLILDEATSALDPVTEQAIDSHLRRRGCTCLIVAHRLSTIRDCDEIVVLDQGRVVERGTHETLWRQGGAYADLIREESPTAELVMDAIWETLQV